MMSRILSCSLAAIAMLAAAPAAAQIDLTEQEMEVFARAAMPAALGSLQTRCNPVLGDDAYMFAQGNTLRTRLTAASDRAWPDAMRLVSRVAIRSNPAMGEIIAAMGPETMKPFVNEMVAGMIASRVDAAQCERIDRVLELLEPLPPENLASLVAYAYAQNRAEEQGRAAGAAR